MEASKLNDILQKSSNNIAFCRNKRAQGKIHSKNLPVLHSSSNGVKVALLTPVSVCPWVAGAECVIFVPALASGITLWQQQCPLALDAPILYKLLC